MKSLFIGEWLNAMWKRLRRMEAFRLFESFVCIGNAPLRGTGGTMRHSSESVDGISFSNLEIHPVI